MICQVSAARLRVSDRRQRAVPFLNLRDDRQHDKRFPWHPFSLTWVTESKISLRPSIHFLFANSWTKTRQWHCTATATSIIAWLIHRQFSIVNILHSTRRSLERSILDSSLFFFNTHAYLNMFCLSLAQSLPVISRSKRRTALVPAASTSSKENVKTGNSLLPRLKFLTEHFRTRDAFLSPGSAELQSNPSTIKRREKNVSFSFQRIPSKRILNRYVSRNAASHCGRGTQTER